MNNKLYYWAENVDNYTSDNDEDYNKVIEIKRLNFYIGKNNAGKSRFLRSTFTSNIEFQDINFISIDDEITKLKKAVTEIQHQSVGFQNQYGSNFREELLRLIEELVNTKKTTSPLNFKKLIDINIPKIRKFYDMHNREKFNLILEDYLSNSRDFYDRYSFEGKFYIPILRGMRPVTEIENKQPYIERAQKDYFKDTQKFNSKNIITGESLYHELKIHLLGEPEQRDLIKKYEEKLSQYFFDNEVVTLIPKFGKDEHGNENDVVHIKIGNDAQFPIYNLGDGLQQAIILTFEAYIKRQDTEGKEQIHAFFIEEPELHMHAGMVRQLMNFYLNETKHYYFFTTHSNHLLDMVDESDQVIIQKFVKEQNKDDPSKFDFKIYRCDRDHELLTSLGVRPSSIYLSNCTIWVEGVTDRMYLSKLMAKYLKEIENSEKENFKIYRSFMPNFHYAFIEYAGGNITHWSFMDDYPSKEEALEFLERNKGLTAKAISKNILLLADGDNEGKAERLKEWETELNSENVYILPCKEIENTLTPSIIYKACLIKFHGIRKTATEVTLNPNTINNLKHKGFNRDTSDFNISNLNDSMSFISKEGIGKIIDDTIRIDPPVKNSPRLFSDESGTIDDKVGFCEICKVLMTYEDWQLTQEAKDLCKKIFEHIKECNP
ncbi:AAA family ATPase [Acinetobacter sp. ANC 4636]